MMLDSSDFKNILMNTPLVSIDILIVSNKKLLMGKRSNKPLQGSWFTPGGRIFKNENFQDAFARIAYTELGLNLNYKDFNLMGVWDHFYNESLFDNVSTHYVNLPHVSKVNENLEIKLDKQHSEFDWKPLESILDDTKKYHKYMKQYASWIINYL